MSRRPGIAGIQSKKLEKEKFGELGRQMANIEISQLLTQYENFRAHLEKFVSQHSKEVKNDPEFRKYFLQLCAKIGVDPLLSSRGIFSKMLGVGDFYYEMATRVCEIAMALRVGTGGLIEVDRVLKHLNKHRTNKTLKISKDDLLRALGQLEILNCGFKLFKIRNVSYVSTDPFQLDKDQMLLLDSCQNLKFYTINQASQKLGWSTERTIHATVS